MSDFNPLDRAKVAVHRSSFDLSSKKLFTAKVGEILPCYWQIAIPGNKYRISSDWFTRTVPVNTAARVEAMITENFICKSRICYDVLLISCSLGLFVFSSDQS